MNDIKNIHIWVSGHVQGVGFRFFTHKQANKLGIKGYVHNLNDGRVEIIATGNAFQLQQFLSWLEQGGPRSAYIEHIESQPFSKYQFTDFAIRY